QAGRAHARTRPRAPAAAVLRAASPEPFAERALQESGDAARVLGAVVRHGAGQEPFARDLLRWTPAAGESSRASVDVVLLEAFRRLPARWNGPAALPGGHDAGPYGRCEPATGR